MGLDMYLKRTKKAAGYVPEQLRLLDSYFAWEDSDKDCSFAEWVGVKDIEVPLELCDEYRPVLTTRYAQWDEKKEFGWDSIFTIVGYWRKANAIHKWFVDNVQDGVDNCDMYEVSKEQLEELYDICNTIYNQCELVKGTVVDGCVYQDEDIFNTLNKERGYGGYVVSNPEIARALLPPVEGFFFGGTDIDQWYLDSVVDTMNIIAEVLNTTDFDTESIFYNSSW